MAAAWSTRTATPTGNTTADIVRDLWLDMLPVDRVEPEDDFFDLGGDSLAAQRLAIALAERTGTRISAADVFRRPQLRAQVDLVTGGESGSPAAGTPVEVLRRDIVLPVSVPADITPRPGPVAEILLTGATGFIGAQLLHDLLTRTPATVHCLVRASDRSSAHQRVVRNLVHFRVWRPEFADRIVAIPGDLSKPRFGLGPDEYHRLADLTDTVVHNGAMVNLTRDYRAHVPANVIGTGRIIELAVSRRPKAVHFVSTLGVVDHAPDEPAGSPEAAPPDEPPSDGYSQSKWVGEHLLAAASIRGLPVTVHRVGEVMPHSRLGVPSRRGLTDLIVNACVITGTWFRSPILMDYTPVDCVSAAVVEAVRTGRTGYFHPVQAGLVGLDDLLAVFAERYRLAEVSYPGFRDTVERTAAERPELTDLMLLLTLLPHLGPADDAAIKEALSGLFQERAAGRTGPLAAELIAAGNLEWPPVSRETFGHYADYYAAAGRLR